MRFEYKDNLPVVTINVKGKSVKSVDAHLDFAYSMTIISSRMSKELQLAFAGFERTATGGGMIVMPTYEAIIEVFGESCQIPVGCLDLPEDTPIKALLGRDILDEHRACLNGKKGIIEVTES